MALIQQDWCPYRKIVGHTCTQGRPCEGTGRGWPSAGLGEVPVDILVLTSSLQDREA